MWFTRNDSQTFASPKIGQKIIVYIQIEFKNLLLPQVTHQTWTEALQ